MFSRVFNTLDLVDPSIPTPDIYNYVHTGNHYTSEFSHHTCSNDYEQCSWDDRDSDHTVHADVRHKPSGLQDYPQLARWYLYMQPRLRAKALD